MMGEIMMYGIKCTLCRADTKSEYTTTQNVKIGKIVKLCNKYLFEIEKQPAKLVKMSRVKKYIQDSKPRTVDDTLSYLELHYIDLIELLRKTR